MAEYSNQELLKAQEFMDKADILVEQLRYVRDHLEYQDPETVKKALDSSANVIEGFVNTGRMQLELQWVLNQHTPLDGS